jgi:hypothetical protein
MNKWKPVQRPNPVRMAEERVSLMVTHAFNGWRTKPGEPEVENLDRVVRDVCARYEDIISRLSNR